MNIGKNVLKKMIVVEEQFEGRRRIFGKLFAGEGGDLFGRSLILLTKWGEFCLKKEFRGGILFWSILWKDGFELENRSSVG